MNTKLRQAFKSFSELNPTSKLECLIMKKIALESQKTIRRKLFFSYFGLVSSAIAAVYAIFVLGNSFLQSEFWSPRSLTFTDAKVVMANWRAYLYSILETLPIFSIIAFLIPIFTLILSLNFYMHLRNKNNFKHYNHYKFA